MDSIGRSLTAQEVLQMKTIHPACAMMPRQSAEEYASLRASIRAGWNATHAIVLFEDKILDGRHRYEACIAEGVEPTFVQWDGAAFNWNPYRFVRFEHEARRNWTSQEQKHLVLSSVLEREGVFDTERERIAAEANARRAEAARVRPRNSDGTLASGTTISGTTGFSAEDQARIDGTLASGGTSCATTGLSAEDQVLLDEQISEEMPAYLQDPDGKWSSSRGAPADAGPASGSIVVAASTIKVHRAREAAATATGTNRGAVQRAEKLRKLAAEVGLPQVVEQVMAGEVKAHAALKSLEETKRAQDMARPVDIALPDGVHRGDFRQLASRIADDSVDLVFTDPPYDEESVELYEAAAREAARILKPGGSMIAYSGQRHLPAVLAGMSKHLRYWWTIAGVHEGGNQMMQKLGLRCGWKPLVWFVKQTRGDVQNVIVDVIRGDREKDSHAWQQAQSEAEYYIRELCSPGGVVVDFFLGGGTTMAAAQAVGRRCIGFEVDAGAIERMARRF